VVAINREVEMSKESEEMEDKKKEVKKPCVQKQIVSKFRNPYFAPFYVMVFIFFALYLNDIINMVWGTKMLIYLNLKRK